MTCRTILKGVPTNAQLTITLLRLAEAARMPIPPPASPNDPTPHVDAQSSGIELHQHLEQRDLDFDASNYIVDEVDPNREPEQKLGGLELQADAKEKGEKPKKGSKLASVFKSTTKTAIGGALHMDHLKAKLGSDGAKRRLGAVSGIGEPGWKAGEGPTTFSARMHGKRGHVVLVTSATSPCVSFVYDKDMPGHQSVLSLGSGPDAPPAAWTLALADVRGLRKVGGFGWKGKLVVGWAMQRPVLDGLEIEDADGEKLTLTAMKGRDALFNRLVAVGGHRWQCQ